MSCNWKTVTLKDVTSKLGDGLHGTPKYSDDGDYFFINGNNLSEGRIIITPKTKRCSQEEYEKHKKDIGDRTILVSINGTLGNVAIYDNEPVFLGKSACYMNVLPDVDMQFIRYVLTARNFQNYIHQQASGSTIKNVSLKLMREFSFKLPSKTEQRKISSVLEQLDNKIANNKAMNQTLEKLAQRIFKSWFIDFDPVKANKEGLPFDGLSPEIQALFPSEFEDSELGMIPKGWEVTPLSKVVKLTGGGTPKRSEASYWNGEIPWFSMKDAPENGEVFVIDTEEKITELGLQKSSTKLLPRGTTIITARGTVGKLALVATDMCMNQSCYGVRGTEVGDYFNYFNIKQAISTLKQNVHGAVFDTITTNTFDTYSFAFSGSEIANAYNELIAPLLEKSEINSRQNITLTRLRDRLLPKLVSGQISVGEAAQELAEAI